MAQIKSSKMRPPFFPGKTNPSSPFRKTDLHSLKRNQLERKQEIDSISKEHAKVSIPDSIKDFSRIKKVVDISEPLDNTKKITELKAAIKNGSYKVDPDLLAKRILDSEY